MPRRRSFRDLATLGAESRRPIVPVRSTASALQALVVFANSATLRTALMTGSGFPLPNDMLAFLMVNQLVYRGAARPTDMAEALQTGTSSVTKVVDRLERAGLVQRVPDATDARAVEICLTDAGRRVGERIVGQLDKIAGGAFRDWSADEVEALERLANKLVRSLDEVSAHAVGAISGVLRPDVREDS
jgi:DNA-binding MarR family transcriptional regulator